MTQTAPPPSSRPQPTIPDEKFWQHYSPHHEAPLSGVASLGLHIVIVALVVLGGYYLSRAESRANRPPNVGLAVVPGLTRLGEEPGPGQASGSQDARTGTLQEDVDASPARRPERPSDAGVELKDPPRPPSEAFKDPAVPGVPAVPDSQKAIDDLQQATRKLRQSILAQQAGTEERPGPRGQDPQGGGTKPGGAGERKGGITAQQQKRVLRWHMVFKTETGDDYARQLRTLGAILAYPDAENDKQYHVIRDLGQRPVKAKIEDLSEIKRIFWIDDARTSVEKLARALGIKPAPGRIVAFFPEEFENKLLKLEHDVAGRAEDEIAETHFEIHRVNGKYEPKVVVQTPRP